MIQNRKHGAESKPIFKSCDNYGLWENSQLPRNTFQEKQMAPQRKGTLIKVKKWNEYPIMFGSHSEKVGEGRKFGSEVRHREVWR